MDKNEAFSKVRNLVNEYRAVKYLEEILESAVNAEAQAELAKQELTRISGEINAKRAELASIDADVKARSGLAQQAMKALKESMEKAQDAANKQSKEISDWLSQLESVRRDREADHQKRLDEMQRQADMKRKELDAEYDAEISKCKAELEAVKQSLADAEANYADFLKKVVK